MKNQFVYDLYAIQSAPCHFYTDEAVDKYNDKIEKYCQTLKDNSSDLSFCQKIKRRFYIAYLDVFDGILFIKNKLCDKFLSSTYNTIPQNILVLCDLHFLEEGELNIISSLEYDFCVLLGDIPFDALVQIKELVTKPIYAVGGNHDTRYMYENVGVAYINGKCVEVNGLSVVGIEGSNRYKNPAELIMLSQEESVEVAVHLPPADILISHDSCFKKYGTSPNKCGLKGITHYIKKHKPKLHLHGHYHIYDKYKIKDTLCIACYRGMLVDTSGSTKKIF